MNTYFKYDTLLTKNEMCSMGPFIKEMTDHLYSYRNIKLLGRRNFGKTSLLKNVIIPDWNKKKGAKALCIYCDLYSVKTLADLEFELAQGLSAALVKKQTQIEKLVTAHT